jgi:hypothetical protein
MQAKWPLFELKTLTKSGLLRFSKFAKSLIFNWIKQIIIANYQKQWGDKMRFLSLTSKNSRFSIAEKNVELQYQSNSSPGRQLPQARIAKKFGDGIWFRVL